MFLGLTKTQVGHHITHGDRFWLPSAPRAIFLTLFQNFCSRVLQEEWEIKKYGNRRKEKSCREIGKE